MPIDVRLFDDAPIDPEVLHLQGLRLLPLPGLDLAFVVRHFVPLPTLAEERARERERERPPD